MKASEKNKNAGTIWTTLLVVIIALVCITLATRAWFSIADNTKLKNMSMDITTGRSLRFDLVEHKTFDEYAKTLGFEQIADRIFLDKGIDITAEPLNPVTTEDGITFYYEHGEDAEPKDYIEFVLHFKATTDMLVHLTTEDSEGKDDGTEIMSDDPGVEEAMRIAFDTGDKVFIYDQGASGIRKTSRNLTILGLSPNGHMEYNEESTLFRIEEGEDVPITVRIWVEGNDEACNNDIKFTNYMIKMRFIGTDDSYNAYD